MTILDDIIASGDLMMLRALALVLTDKELLDAYRKATKDKNEKVAYIFHVEFYERLTEMLPTPETKRTFK